MPLAHALNAIFITIASLSLIAAEPSDRKVSTIAGEVSIVEKVEFKQYDLTLNGKTLVSTHADGAKAIDGWPMMSIMADIKQRVGDVDEILLIQHAMLGNACSNGPIRVLALGRNGTVVLTEPIIHCRNNRPIITWSQHELCLYYTRHPNKAGDDEPEALWVFRDGCLTQNRDPDRIKAFRDLRSPRRTGAH